MKSNYRNEYIEWFKPSLNRFSLACCDCSLVHDIKFRIKGKTLELNMKRNNRATMNMRRYWPVVARKTVAEQLSAIAKRDKLLGIVP